MSCEDNSHWLLLTRLIGSILPLRLHGIKPYSVPVPTHTRYEISLAGHTHSPWKWVWPARLHVGIDSIVRSTILSMM